MQQRRHVPLKAWWLALVAGLGLPVLTLPGSPLAAAEPEKSKQTIQAEAVTDTVWKTASKEPITSAEIDELITQKLLKAGVKPAPLVTDEQFIRRAYLDLWGKPPSPANVRDFVANKDPHKRARLIDTLLDGEAFSRHWARYWHDVIAARLVNNFQSRLLARSFERWIADQLHKNRSWADITRDILTASGEARFDDPPAKSGPAWFLASHMGADAVVEQAAETARVFMGIQINCAQCHDHPFDQWKREQFHELAAYFARVRTRLVREEGNQGRFVGINLVSMDRGGFGRGFGFGGRGRFGGEYRMPAKDNPRGGTIMHPRSLDGKAPGRGLKDIERRKALVDSIVNKDNHWFSAAFVNRTWGVLLGQAFYQPVDDLGPQREAIHGEVLARLGAAFTGSGHDIKNLFRVVMNTQTYQRQSRVGKSRSEHLLFAWSYPTRLRPDALWESLVNTLGPLDRGGFGGGRRPGFGGRGFGRGGLEAMIRNEFSFDPSLKNDDVEGSVPQGLALMNSPQIHQKIRAQGTNLLGRVLRTHSTDESALEAVYLQALCRKPTQNEVTKCVAHVKKVGDRAEAFEDILWALINSTEFQTRR